jgi:tRNA(fMet)-specific endonuclease VapC
MYLLDTTHCLGFLFGLPNIIQKTESLDSMRLSTSIAVCGELLDGVYKSERVIENLHDLERFLRNIIIHDIDWETADIFAKLTVGILNHFGPKDKQKRRNFRLDSLGFKDNDLWIASTAIQYNLILVSADSDLLNLDGIQGLKVENW